MTPHVYSSPPDQGKDMYETCENVFIRAKDYIGLQNEGLHRAAKRRTALKNPSGHED